MINYHEAIKAMHAGQVVKYIGTVNGNVFTDKGISFCMCRGVVFEYRNGKPLRGSAGAIVYDPDFRYVITTDVNDTRYWPQ